jgi:threonylcarbamoyladenosine tRNA methylthiotransferase MtaB
MTNRKLKVAFSTLGCKLNFSETSTIKRFFGDDEYEKVGFHEPADIYIINTCTVTSAADKKCRHAIYHAASMSPGAFLVVTGCYAELQADKLATIKGVDIVLGENEKFNILRYINDRRKRLITEVHSCPTAEAVKFFPSYSLGDRTRSFLKIQDGCDYKCSYCTVPLARGKSRNASISEILSDAGKIADAGICEIVLTGVNIGDFGKSTGESFYELITELDKIKRIERFRISSIEPDLLSPEIIQFIAGSEHFVPHFHIPLQSGSDRILGLMQRRYNINLFAELIKSIKNNIPGACIGVDVIVGFPSESVEDFDEIHNFLSGLDISYLHVFSYSARPGTTASQLANRVDPKEINRRSKVLHRLSEAKRITFYKSNLGQTAGVLAEDRRAGDNMTGYTGNYIKVEIPADPRHVNKIIKVILNHINSRGNVTGLPVNIPDI